MANFPFKIEKVNTKPTVPCLPNTMYLEKVDVGNKLVVHVSNTLGTSLKTSLTEATYAQSIAGTLRDDVHAIRTPDITSRDALSLPGSRFVIVTDASDDEDVDSGEALYLYDASTSSFELIMESNLEGWEADVVEW